MITERVACRRSGAEVEELLRDYASSGLSRRKFGLSRGVAVSTLGYYLKRSREEAAGAQQQLVAVELSHLHRGVAQTEPLLEHLGGFSAAECIEDSGLVVVLTCDRRIEVRRGFDAGVLEQLVRALERV